MDVKNLKDLEKIIGLCRKKGVKSIKFPQSGGGAVPGEGCLHLELTDEPPETAYKRKKRASLSPGASTYVPTEGGITDEDLIGWSSDLQVSSS